MTTKTGIFNNYIASDDDKVTAQIKDLNKKFESFEKKIKDLQLMLDMKDSEIKELKTNFEALEIFVKNVEKETGEIKVRNLNEGLPILENSTMIPEK